MDLSDVTGSPWFQLSYPLLNGLLAGSGNRGYQAATGLNVGLGVANRLGEQAKADQQQKALSQSLGSVLKSTTPVQSTQNVASMPINPQTAQFSMPEPAVKAETAHADDIVPSTGGMAVPMSEQTITTQKPNFSPQAQSLGDALINAGRPDAVLQILAQQAFRQPKETVVAPGHVVLQDNHPVYTAPNAPVREPTPPRPVFGTQGGEGVSSTYNAATKQWETNRSPLTAAPARAVSDEERRLKEAQIGLTGARTGEARAQTGAAGALASERNARTANLQKLAKDLADPKITKEKATTIYSTAIRDRETLRNAMSDDPEDTQRLNDANALVDESRRRLAELSGGGARAAQPAPAAAKPPGKPIGKTKDGKTVYQSPDGKKYVAN